MPTWVIFIFQLVDRVCNPWLVNSPFSLLNHSFCTLIGRVKDTVYPFLKTRRNEDSVFIKYNFCNTIVLYLAIYHVWKPTDDEGF